MFGRFRDKNESSNDRLMIETDRLMTSVGDMNKNRNAAAIQ